MVDDAPNPAGVHGEDSRKACVGRPEMMTKKRRNPLNESLCRRSRPLRLHDHIATHDTIQTFSHAEKLGHTLSWHSTVESMAKRVAGHDPLLSGIQPHRLMWSTDTFQMPSLTIRGAYDTGNLKELIIDLEEKLPYECVEFTLIT